MITASKHRRKDIYLTFLQVSHLTAFNIEELQQKKDAGCFNCQRVHWLFRYGFGRKWFAKTGFMFDNERTGCKALVAKTGGEVLETAFWVLSRNLKKLTHKNYLNFAQRRGSAGKNEIIFKLNSFLSFLKKVLYFCHRFIFFGNTNRVGVLLLQCKKINTILIVCKTNRKCIFHLCHNHKKAELNKKPPFFEESVATSYSDYTPFNHPLSSLFGIRKSKILLSLSIQIARSFCTTVVELLVFRLLFCSKTPLCMMDGISISAWGLSFWESCFVRNRADFREFLAVKGCPEALWKDIHHHKAVFSNLMRELLCTAALVQTWAGHFQIRQFLPPAP